MLVIITILRNTKSVFKFKFFSTLYFRNSERSLRSQLDLCVVVFRCSSEGSPQLGKLVEHSKRQVQ